MIEFLLAGIKWGFAAAGFVSTLFVVVAVVACVVFIATETLETWKSRRAQKRRFEDAERMK